MFFSEHNDDSVQINFATHIWLKVCLYFCFIVRLYYWRWLFKTKRDFINLYLNKTDTFLLESLMHDVFQTSVFKRVPAIISSRHIDPFKAAGPV